MKKTFQVERGLTVGGNTTKVFTFTLQEAYAKCAGFFLTANASNTSFDDITIGLAIAQQEVLPLCTDASLFALSAFVSRHEAMYDISDENIPARSSDVTLTVTNNSNYTQKFNAYFVLTNA